ncbi:hypothetical protein ABPG74_013973 [Tetrahymena malaccensis]
MRNEKNQVTFGIFQSMRAQELTKQEQLNRRNISFQFLFFDKEKREHQIVKYCSNLQIFRVRYLFINLVGLQIKIANQDISNNNQLNFKNLSLRSKIQKKTKLRQQKWTTMKWLDKQSQWKKE